MDRLNYMLSAKGAYSHFLYRRLNRNIHLSFSGEPLTKNRMNDRICDLTFRSLLILKLAGQLGL